MSDKILFIVGPTASGKSALAMDLALELGGEIISADSRAVYRGMDIGTAKPLKKDQQLVPHWGIDLLEPVEKFTAADFKVYTDQKIQEIQSRGRLPIVVGGTGLYVDSVLFDFQFSAKSDEKQLQKLEKMSVDELQKYSLKHNISLPENKNNKRYLIRQIMRGGDNKSRTLTPITGAIVVGITTDKDVLKNRITQRTDQLFADGMLEEAVEMHKKYGTGYESMTGNIYNLIADFLDGKLDFDGLKQKFITADWRLAKRQLTYLKRNPFIHWATLENARALVLQLLHD